MSGIKKIFHKSEIFCLGKADSNRSKLEEIFTCGSGVLPMKYLDIPIDHKRLKNSDWQGVEDRTESKLSCWKGQLLSIRGRLILVNSSLSNVPFYMMSFYRLPKGVRKRMYFFRATLPRKLRDKEISSD